MFRAQLTGLSTNTVKQVIQVMRDGNINTTNLGIATVNTAGRVTVENMGNASMGWFTGSCRIYGFTMSWVGN